MTEERLEEQSIMESDAEAIKDTEIVESEECPTETDTEKAEAIAETEPVEKPEPESVSDKAPLKETTKLEKKAAVDSKAKKLGISGIRHIVQVVVLILFMLPLLISGWGLFGTTYADGATLNTPSSLPFFGSLSSSSVGPVAIVDVFAGLQVILASKSLPLQMLLGMLPVLIVYGLIRGRAFCGWVCPVNLLMEFVDWLRLKTKLQPAEKVLPRHTKVYVAAAILVLSLILSVPVFEILSPISALNKLILFGSFAGVLTLVAIILAELFWGHRVWCRSICPLGGFYEVLGKVGIVNVKLDRTSCIHCNKCKDVCLCDPEILGPSIDGVDSLVRAGDCMLCGKCVDVCPVQALSIGIGRGTKKDEPAAS